MSTVFASGNVLAASDLNDNMLQSMSTSALRVIAGQTAYSFSAVNAVNQAITWGVTLGSFVCAMFAVQSASNIDIIGTWLTTSPPNTTGGTVRLANWQASSQTSPTVTVSGQIHWIVWGT